MTKSTDIESIGQSKGVSRRAVLRDGAALAVAGVALGGLQAAQASTLQGQDAELVELFRQWCAVTDRLKAAFKVPGYDQAWEERVVDQIHDERFDLENQITDATAESLTGAEIKLAILLYSHWDWLTETHRDLIMGALDVFPSKRYAVKALDYLEPCQLRSDANA